MKRIRTSLVDSRGRLFSGRLRRVTMMSATCRIAPILALLVLAACQNITQPNVEKASLAYVLNSCSADVSVIETASNTVTATVRVGEGPIAVAFTPS